MIVAIDGPAGVGKSAAARRLARRLGFVFLDTGALYRAVTWKALQEGIPLERTDEVLRSWERSRVDLSGSGDEFRVRLDGRDISRELRRPEVEGGVQAAAEDPRVRQAMVSLQRSFARGRDVVAEGRDTTTVVFPDAEVKFYLDADLAERARRRARQREEAGLPADPEEVEREIEARDEADRSRDVSPLVQAKDSIRIDTTHLALEEVVERMAGHVAKRRAQGAG